MHVSLIVRGATHKMLWCAAYDVRVSQMQRQYAPYIRQETPHMTSYATTAHLSTGARQDTVDCVTASGREGGSLESEGCVKF